MSHICCAAPSWVKTASDSTERARITSSKWKSEVSEDKRHRDDAYTAGVEQFPRGDATRGFYTQQDRETRSPDPPEIAHPRDECTKPLRGNNSLQSPNLLNWHEEGSALQLGRSSCIRGNEPRSNYNIKIQPPRALSAHPPALIFCRCPDDRWGCCCITFSLCKSRRAESEIHHGLLFPGGNKGLESAMAGCWDVEFARLTSRGHKLKTDRFEFWIWLGPSMRRNSGEVLLALDGRIV
ncbi:hypothetical protein B0H16DRAFT_1683180 [Mycena metata]|uniref:Uncharacterized protein n=1 Tax=Mycena metata TaxID=1033252 RepID=A0AAD7KBY9_9AGAR|nr:hypothetical protein B0H16DRAFT_1683180 [Mycena metata]